MGVGWGFQVRIDSYVDYNKHITELASSCIFRLSCINRIKHLDRKTLILLINAFAFSKLLYCSTVWSNASKQNLNKLQSVQNFACRIILGLRKYDHITEGLKSLKWLSVRDKLLLNICTMVFKCLNNQAPTYLCNRLVRRSSVHNRNTRRNSDLYLPKCRLATGQRSFAFRAAKLCDELPSTIKQANQMS